MSISTDLTREKSMELIIQIFSEKVRGKKPDTKDSNQKHTGKVGHWLEKRFGIEANGKNAPDIFEFEMKTDTKSKTSFGDWSPDYWIFKNKKNPSSKLTRDMFLKLFGKPNLEKGNRHSWSGEPFPKIKGWNNFGQILKLDKENNILAVYSYEKDKRPNKGQLIPAEYKGKEVILAKWSKSILQKKLENKFSKFGWFKCIQNTEGIFTHINFGAPINFELFLEHFLKGKIIIDSGMYEGNLRPYMTWRADNKFWDSLVIYTFINDKLEEKVSG